MLPFSRDKITYWTKQPLTLEPDLTCVSLVIETGLYNLFLTTNYLLKGYINFIKYMVFFTWPSSSFKLDVLAIAGVSDSLWYISKSYEYNKTVIQVHKLLLQITSST